MHIVFVIANNSSVPYFNWFAEKAAEKKEHTFTFIAMHAEKPKMIIAGASAYSREWDYKRMREIADKIGAIFMVDMAHPAGLIAAGLLDNPAEYAHIVTSTTHKTLRGPRGGIIMIGKDFENPFGETLKSGKLKKITSELPVIYTNKLIRTIKNQNEQENLSDNQIKLIADKLQQLNIIDRKE